ncbi:GntR family transcriptional regulator [Alsobacter sp. KACC 23698]|uniref:GntR family transcriptional regulator n=1 Tax=Alsobacter sp. KACC 23698 TaxID=3149229 RepID=A0AAU7JL10_9HYPH
MSAHKHAIAAEAPTVAGPSSPPAPGMVARGGESLSEIAYDRIEDLIVHRVFAPGASTTTKDLQDAVNVGRTPVHQAVRRLAAETLIQIRPRDGLMVSPISLERDRRLLQLRRDMDRFVIRSASRNATGNIRSQLLHLTQQLKSRRDLMSLAEFNTYDRQLDRALMDATGEPFLDRTLRPLHTVFRRIGGLYLSQIGGPEGLLETIDHHLELLEAVLHAGVDDAILASDRLIEYADGMFVGLEARIDPALLDVRLSDYGQHR